MKIALIVLFLLAAGEVKLFLSCKTVYLTNSWLLDPEWGADLTFTREVLSLWTKRRPDRTCSTGLWDPALSLPPTTWPFLLSTWLPLPNLLTLSSRSSSPLYLTPLVISAVFGLSQHLYAESSLTVTPSSALSSAPRPTSPRVPASPLHLMPHSLSWNRMPGLLPMVPQKVFPSLWRASPPFQVLQPKATVQSLMPLLLWYPDCLLSTEHLLTSNCTQNQTLPQCLQYTALPVSFKGKAKDLEWSTGPYHAFSLWPLLLLVFSHTGLLPALEAQRAPPTLESWHWLVPPALGLCLAVLLKFKLQIPMPTLSVPYWQCFFTGLTYNNVTSMRVRVFFLFCSLCIPKAYNSFWV